MSKKPTLQQRNAAKLDDLLKQKVSTKFGFLNEDLKRHLAEAVIKSANNNKKLLTKSDTLQKRYDSFKALYDKLFFEGMTGHALFPGTLEAKALKDIDNGVEYFINEKDIIKPVSHAELSYKIELFTYKLSTQYDIAFTKFKPFYKQTGKGEFSITYNIPDLSEIDLDEMTTEEVMEWFEDNGIVVIISDPSKIKNMAEREEFKKSKRKRQANIERNKKKYYDQWQKEKKSPKRRK